MPPPRAPSPWQRWTTTSRKTYAEQDLSRDLQPHALASDKTRTQSHIVFGSGASGAISTTTLRRMLTKPVAVVPNSPVFSSATRTFSRVPLAFDDQNRFQTTTTKSFLPPLDLRGLRAPVVTTSATRTKSNVKLGENTQTWATTARDHYHDCDVVTAAKQRGKATLTTRNVHIKFNDVQPSYVTSTQSTYTAPENTSHETVRASIVAAKYNRSSSRIANIPNGSYDVPKDTRWQTTASASYSPRAPESPRVRATRSYKTQIVFGYDD